MRIDSSVIGMESERNYSSAAVRVTTVTMTASGQGIADGSGNLSGERWQYSEDAGQAKENSEDYYAKTMEEMQSKQALRTRSVRTSDAQETRRQLHSIRQQCLEFLMSLLFDRSGGILGRRYAGVSQKADAGEASVQSAAKQSESSAGTANSTTFTFTRQYYYEESENTVFTTQGTVKCADGREISFYLNLSMSRSFQEYYEQNYAVLESVMTDPLVINLDGNIAELSDQTFYFDIDGDGEMDEINRLAGGSGYLALDKNGDGVINDGTELFGTASGNGFADLAEYDSDGNGFIDEGDEIWDKLKIWTMDENGNEELVSLSEKGIGAICLQNVSSDFSLTGQDNQLKGTIRNTGFFLYENGMAGTIQHVDVVKYDQAV